MDMRKHMLALFASLAIGVLAVAHATVPVVSVDYGIEGSTDTTLLPTSTSGSVVLTCADCGSRSYQVTDATTFFVGTAPVSLAQLLAFAKTGGPHNLTVFIKPKAPVVTRIVIAGQLPR
jgi:hypothetical protein